MKLSNFTPHPVVVRGVSFPSEGIARLSEVTEHTEDFDFDGVPESVPLVRTVRGTVEGLPPFENGTLLIVSGLILDANAGFRADLVAPFTGTTGNPNLDPIRDAQGRIQGVNSLRA